MKSLISIILILFSVNVYAESFKYDLTFTCGPRVLKQFEDYSTLGSDRWEFYFFNMNTKIGEFVILHDDIQYKSFEETKLEQIYQQNGGIHEVQMEKNLDLLTFKFKITVPKFNSIKTMIVDLNAMTYIARVNMEGMLYKPSKGICFDLEKH